MIHSFLTLFEYDIKKMFKMLHFIFSYLLTSFHLTFFERKIWSTSEYSYTFITLNSYYIPSKLIIFKYIYYTNNLKRDFHNFIAIYLFEKDCPCIWTFRWMLKNLFILKLISNRFFIELVYSEVISFEPQQSSTSGNSLPSAASNVE